MSETTDTTSARPGSVSLFYATLALAIGGLLLLVFGGVANVTIAAGIGGLSLLMSLVTMYADIRSIGREAWGGRPEMYPLMGAFMYPMVVYVYGRVRYADY